ncbi:MAG: alpha-L-rhamnosidase [Clostridiales bacterium]|nr:alpha-L-rhamnosidase [Clostridiales bacterium]MDK2992182.1 alpha-L-rhamnosidase [Clostridiales bacterium]
MLSNIYAPINLKCDYMADFLGIDNPKPIFSWELKHDQPNQSQTAYQQHTQKHHLWTTEQHNEHTHRLPAAS